MKILHKTFGRFFSFSALLFCLALDAGAENLKRPSAVPKDHTIIHVSMNGYSGRSYSIIIDLIHSRIDGSIVEPKIESDFGSSVSTRYVLESPKALPKELRKVIESQIATIRAKIPPPESEAESERATVDGDVPQVCAAKAPFDPEHSECVPLEFPAYESFEIIEKAFLSLNPKQEEVYWTGRDFRKTNDQPARDKTMTVLNLLRSSKSKTFYALASRGTRSLTLKVHFLRGHGGFKISGRIIDNRPCDWITYSIETPLELDKKSSHQLEQILRKTSINAKSSSKCPGGEYQRIVELDRKSVEDYRKQLEEDSDERRYIMHSGGALCDTPLKSDLRPQPTTGSIHLDEELREYNWPERNLCNTLTSGEIFDVLDSLFMNLKPEKDVMNWKEALKHID